MRGDGRRIRHAPSGPPVEKVGPLKLFPEKLLLWFSDVARIALRPDDATFRMVISRNRRFEETLPLLLFSLILANAIGWVKTAIQSGIQGLILTVLLVPALLVVHAGALRWMTRDREQAVRGHEAFFHIGALTASAGFLAGRVLAFLPVPLGIIIAIPVFMYLFLGVMAKGIQSILGISFGRALTIHLAGVLLTGPLFFLCAAFYVALPGAIGLLYR
jgi:hypothetical protein